jgi:hypothetical protein
MKQVWADAPRILKRPSESFCMTVALAGVTSERFGPMCYMCKVWANVANILWEPIWYVCIFVGLAGVTFEERGLLFHMYCMGRMQICPYSCAGRCGTWSVCAGVLNVLDIFSMTFSLAGMAHRGLVFWMCYIIWGHILHESQSGHRDTPKMLATGVLNMLDGLRVYCFVTVISASETTLLLISILIDQVIEPIQYDCSHYTNININWDEPSHQSWWNWPGGESRLREPSCELWSDWPSHEWWWDAEVGSAVGPRNMGPAMGHSERSHFVSY